MQCSISSPVPSEDALCFWWTILTKRKKYHNGNFVIVILIECGLASVGLNVIKMYLAQIAIVDKAISM